MERLGRPLGRQRRRTAIAAAVALVGAGGGASAAEAAVLTRCGKDPRVLCGRVSVPLDRTGALPGRISLAVRLVRAPGPRRGTVLFLPGGPGQSATPALPFLADPKLSPLGPLVRTHDLLLVDQRGTGDSGLLRCPLLEATEEADPALEIAACARRLGPRRDYFQTRDVVEDLEQVRTALSLPRLSIIAVSYGTKVAMTYASRHPEGVARLVLDSVVPPGGPDPLFRPSMAAAPRILGDICGGGCRRRVNPDPLGDLRALVAQIRQGGPLLGFAVGFDGRRRAKRLDRSDLFGVMLTGDLGLSPIFPGLPAAMRSARQGDTGPLLRLREMADSIDLGESPRLFSVALLVSTSCGELGLPWSPATPLGDRVAEARARVLSLGDAPFEPFDAETALQAGFISLCAAWPTSARPPSTEPGPLPDVPILVLNGTRDMRTPLEGARAAVAGLPRAHVVPVAGVGHSPLGTDPSGCAPRAVQRFLLGRPPGTCSRRRALIPPSPVAPTSLDQVRAAPGLPVSIGRTVCAIGLTIEDASVALLGGAVTRKGRALSIHVPGLRAGLVRASIVRRRLVRAVFEGYSYVRGVVVSGRPRGGTLRISGSAAARGTVRIQRPATVMGRLGGRPVRASLRPCLGPDAQALFSPEATGEKVEAVMRPRLNP